MKVSGYQCDRCKAFYADEGEDNYFSVKPELRLQKQKEIGSGLAYYPLDLCPACELALVRWFNPLVDDGASINEQLSPKTAYNPYGPVRECCCATETLSEEFEKFARIYNKKPQE